MSRKVYWNLLVFFGVLCQEIIGTHWEKEIDGSSDFLARQKRVINGLPGGDIRHPIKNSPYVVAIKQLRTHETCTGVILTNHIVLTVAKCINIESPIITYYRVYSGCARLSRNACPKIHKIAGTKTNIGNHPLRPHDGITLITVTPPFIFSINTRKIELYQGPVHPGVRASVVGWGCNPITEPPRTAHPEWLRLITVPVISIEDCNILYLEHFTVTDSDICTLDAFGHQYCGTSDVGAPLVLPLVGDLHELVGIHLWNGGIAGRSNPDVFVNLQHPRYKSWILENIQH